MVDALGRLLSLHPEHAEQWRAAAQWCYGDREEQVKERIWAEFQAEAAQYTAEPAARENA